MSTFYSRLASISSFCVTVLVIYAMWSMFVVPIGITSISLFQAFGLLVLYKIFSVNSVDLMRAREMPPISGRDRCLVIGFRLLLLGCAWLAYQLNLAFA